MAMAGMAATLTGALWLVPNLGLVGYIAVAVLPPDLRRAGFPLAAAGITAVILSLPQGREILFVVAENGWSGQYRSAFWGGAGLLMLSLWPAGPPPAAFCTSRRTRRRATRRPRPPCCGVGGHD